MRWLRLCACGRSPERKSQFSGTLASFRQFLIAGAGADWLCFCAGRLAVDWLCFGGSPRSWLAAGRNDAAARETAVPCGERLRFAILSRLDARREGLRAPPVGFVLSASALAARHDDRPEVL